METWLLLLVMSLAVYRLTRLVVEDDFPPVLWVRHRITGGWRPLTEPEREQLAEVSRAMPFGGPIPDHAEVPDGTPEWVRGVRVVEGQMSRYVRRPKWSPQWLADLISCPWCASGWVAAGVTAGTWAVVGLPVPVLVWAGVWAVGALLAAQVWA
jgi:hypothetical protein